MLSLSVSIFSNTELPFSPSKLERQDCARLGSPEGPHRHCQKAGRSGEHLSFPSYPFTSHKPLRTLHFPSLSFLSSPSPSRSFLPRALDVHCLPHPFDSTPAPSKPSPSRSFLLRALDALCFLILSTLRLLLRSLHPLALSFPAPLTRSAPSSFRLYACFFEAFILSLFPSPRP